MRFVSFNVNGLRSRLHQLEAVIARHEPEIIGLQETKVQDDAFPRADVEALGYHVIHVGQKGHYGVALLTRTEAEAPCLGLPAGADPADYGFEDSEEGRVAMAESRLIGATVPTSTGPVRVYNGYFPQGESRDHPRKFPNKRAFYTRLQALLRDIDDPATPVVVMGDMNVAPRDTDIGIGDDNRKRWLRTGKCSFLPEEREWLDALMAWGLTDLHAGRDDPETRDRYSWFDYRSRGFERDPKRGLRIDLILASDPLAQRLRATGIDYDVRAMEKPSDHCPVWADFDASP